MLAAREGHSVVACGPHLYSMGGWGPGYTLSSVERYDVVRDVWETKSSMRSSRAYMGAY